MFSRSGALATGAALVAGLLSPTAGGQDKAVITAAPPPGFEDLTAPQLAPVDLYHLDRPLGSAMATYAPGTFIFEDPAAVVALLPPLVDADAVLAALSGPIDPNVDRACGLHRLPGCGTLDPPVAGAIFDSSRFRADLFVAPEMLSAERQAVYLPPPAPGLSTVQSMAAAMAGTDEEAPSYNLRLFSLLAAGNGRVRGETSLSSDDGVLVDTLAAEYDRRDSRYAAGLFRTAPLPIVGERRMAGVAFETTTDLRLDVAQAYGSDLVLFLPRQAQVEILRDGRLLDSRVYGPGNHALDTSALPDGAYEVTLRIREAGGGVREERRFFAKSAELPPLGAPRYVVELGTFATEGTSPLPDLADEPVLHGGAGWRLSDAVALSIDGMLSARQSGVELNGFYLSPLARFRAGGLAATDGDYGVSAGADGVAGPISYSAGIRQVWSGEEEMPSADGRSTDEVIDLVSRTSTQLNLATYYSMDSGPRIGFRARWQRDRGGSAVTAGPSLFWTLFDDGGRRIDLSADATRSDTETVVLARLRFAFDRPDYSFAAQAGVSQRVSGRGPAETPALAATGEVEAGWRDGDWLDGDLQMRAGLRGDTDDASLRLGGDYAGDRGRLSFDGEHAVEGGGGTRYGGSALLSLVGNGASFGLGGQEIYRSGVVLRVDGEGDTAFDVFVNDQPRGRIRTGETRPLLLPEYDVYRIRLVPVDADFVDFDASPRAVTLYPGTVARLTWEVTRIKVAFGRAVLEDGTPVADARIVGGLWPTATDELGYFQVDLGRERTLRLTARGMAPCAIVIGVLADTDFSDVGTLVCHPAE